MRSPRSAWPALVAAGVLAGSSPQLFAQTPTEDALRQRVEELEEKLKRLEQRLEQSVPPAVPQATASAEPSAREQVLQQRVDELDQQVRVLGRRQELEQEEEAAVRKAAPTVTANDSGLSVRSGDGQNTFRLRGLIQADGRFFIDDQPADIDTFLLRRVRPILEGTLGGIYDFRFMPDFAGSRVVVQDAWVHARFKPYAQLRAGKFKEPVGLERLQGGADIRFAERAFPTNVLPNRDIGLQISGDLFSNRLEYQVGYFNGVVDGRSNEDFTNDQDNNTDKDWAARLFAHPFRNSDGLLHGLGIGFAGSYGDQRGRSGTTSQDTNLPSYRSLAQQAVFSYRTSAAGAGTFQDGERIRISPQAYYYRNALGVIAEYADVSTDVRRNVAVGNSRRDTIGVDAWQVAVTYLLTGEDNSFRGIKPRSPFAIGKPGWGAFEIGVRYTGLNIDEDAFAGGAASFADPTTAVKSAKAWGLGVNWYLTSNIRFLLDYERTEFEWGGGGTAAAPLDREDEELVFGRIQVGF